MVWFILGGIVLLIVVLLIQSVTVTVDYESGKEFELKAKYLFFTVFRLPEKPKKKKKKKTVKNKNKPKKQKTPPEEKQPETLPETDHMDSPPETEETPKAEEKETAKPKKTKSKIDFDTIKQMISNAKPPMLRLFRKIRVKQIYIDILVGGEDAAKTALNYGKFNIAVNGFLCWLTNTLTVEVKEVNIEADFSKEESDLFAHAKIKLRLSTMIACAIWFIGRTMKTTMNAAKPTKPKKSKKSNSDKRKVQQNG